MTRTIITGTVGNAGNGKSAAAPCTARTCDFCGRAKGVICHRPWVLNGIAGPPLWCHLKCFLRARKVVDLALDKPATSSRVVNLALKARGHHEVLVRGRGYWYFADGEASGWFSSSVPVFRITDLTLRRWLQERDNLASDYRNHPAPAEGGVK